MPIKTRRNLLVSLEGNIGSGKSTLIAKIAAEFAAKKNGRAVAVLTEPVDLWARSLSELGGKSMLQSYYEDGPANSFAFQMFVLKTRLDQVISVSPGRTILSERCMNSHDSIFATGARSRGHIGDVEWVTYRGWVDSVTHMSGEEIPNGVIYLRTLPGICAQRRRARNRCAEADLPDELLQGLHEVHDAYIRGLTEQGVPVLLVDGNVDEATMSESDVHDIVRVIVGFVDGLHGEKAKVV